MILPICNIKIIWLKLLDQMHFRIRVFFYYHLYQFLTTFKVPSFRLFLSISKTKYFFSRELPQNYPSVISSGSDQNCWRRCILEFEFFTIINTNFELLSKCRYFGHFQPIWKTKYFSSRGLRRDFPCVISRWSDWNCWRRCILKKV